MGNYPRQVCRSVSVKVRGVRKFYRFPHPPASLVPAWVTALWATGSSQPSPHCFPPAANSSASPLHIPNFASSCPLQGAQLYHAPHPPNTTPSWPKSRDLAQGLPSYSTLLSSWVDSYSLLRPAGPHPCPLRLFSSRQGGHAGRPLS